MYFLKVNLTKSFSIGYSSIGYIARGNKPVMLAAAEGH
ncbi:hypothetical protein MuYL_1317 [Mucilaginibacter xinganensis]|uniref:Uncharacterized protein n=1 Tax=Mucilaginibacter xinganensis TaxID=1234841 RepID=A0A223NTJ5_9SPHI|nr:hypothetical protein MuYL_1317 [Mucilaginibacter xinganensis]